MFSACLIFFLEIKRKKREGEKEKEKEQGKKQGGNNHSYNLFQAGWLLPIKGYSKYLT